MRSLAPRRKSSLVRTLPAVLVICVALLVQAGLVANAASTNHVRTSNVGALTFNAANFPRSTRIDNRFYPLLPGTDFIYKGVEVGQAIRDSVFVTRQTKKILGVPTVVVLDTITLANGQLFEKTLDWYAQDQYSNVWYFGEYSTQYKNGKPVSHDGSWEGGVHGAIPGIVMEGNPIVGDIYRQEYQKGVAQDMAGVLNLNAYICVPYNCYFNDALLTKEWSPLEPGVLEHKWYAPGVGFVHSTAVKGPVETVDLVAIQQH